MSNASLYQRLGGEAVIYAIVTDLFANHLNNPVIRVRYLKSDSNEVIRKVAEFFAAGAGGPKPCSHGPIPVRRYKREEMLPHAQALYKVCLAAGFPESPDQNHPDSTGVGPTPSNNQEGVRMSTALAYLDQARHRPNLTVRANVTARRILFAGKWALGVEAESDGERFTVEGEQIVLSGGFIASPQLLMLSGVGPAQQLRNLGVEVVQDLPGVGQNLRDHPYVPILFRETGKAPDFRQAAVQVVLRYTAEGSTTRNDMQIGQIHLVSAYLPANVPIRKDENCFFIYANIQRAVSVGS